MNLCHELLAVVVINDILDSNDELKKYIYISFQNMLNKHYDVMMDMVNDFNFKNCFSKKTMSQDLDKITFSSEFKSCVEKFYLLLQKADCETLITFGKIMNTLPHEKKSATFLVKLRKLIQSKQKGGKVLINGTNMTKFNDNEVIQGMGIKGAISSFLKNIVDYENPGEFDDSTKNLFRMLHTLYSSNMNIFVIVMAKIMKQLYGTSFKYASGKNEEFKMDHYESRKKRDDDTIESRVKANKDSYENEDVTNARSKINDANKDKYISHVTPHSGGYYRTLDKMLKGKEEKNKESAEELIKRGERRILELIMKEIKGKNITDEDIEKMEDLRVKATVALSKPNKSRIEELVNTKQSGGTMKDTDTANFDIIYEKYGPWADKIINQLNQFVVELNNNEGFISLSNKFKLSSINGAVDTLGSMISEALIAPTIYMDMATGVMGVFNDNFNSAIQNSHDENEAQNKKLVEKFNFYDKNINEFVDVLVDIISKLSIPDGPKFEEYKKDQEKILKDTGTNLKSTSSSSSSSWLPSFSSSNPEKPNPEKPTYKIPGNPQSPEPTGPKTLKNLFNTKRDEYESKVYDQATKTAKVTAETELYDIINRKQGQLPPEEKRLSILLHLYDLSSQIKKKIQEIKGSGEETVAVEVSIVGEMPKITKSMEELKTYLIANKASIMDTTWDDQFEISAAKAKLATNEESQTNAKSQVKQMLRDTKSTVSGIGKEASKQYSDFNTQLSNKMKGKMRGGGQSIGENLAVGLFNALKETLKEGGKIPTKKQFQQYFEESVKASGPSEQSVSKGRSIPISSTPNGAFVMITFQDYFIYVFDKMFDVDKNPPGKWTFPGGKQENDDSLAFTATKELFEETKGLLLIDEDIFIKAERAGAFTDDIYVPEKSKNVKKRCYYINITGNFDIYTFIGNYNQNLLIKDSQPLDSYNETTNICAFNETDRYMILNTNPLPKPLSVVTHRTLQAINKSSLVKKYNISLESYRIMSGLKLFPSSDSAGNSVPSNLGITYFAKSS